MVSGRFHDRVEAGRALGEALGELPREDLIILGLARGGVPVAYEVAQILAAPLDVLVVSKLGAPNNPEFAIGALASGGVELLHEASVASVGISPPALANLIAREKAALQAREDRLRRNRAPLALAGKTVVLVDDGMATGATMTAAVRAVRKRAAKRVVVAVPTASKQAQDAAADEADEVHCLMTPRALLLRGHLVSQFRSGVRW